MFTVKKCCIFTANVKLNLMEPNNCPRCKTENASNQKYCKGCGFTLPKAAVEESTTKFPSLRPNRERAKGVMYTMGLALALMIPVLLIQGLWARIAFLITHAEQVPIAVLGASLLAQMALVFLMLIVSIITLIYFLSWFHRAYYNLRLIKGKTRYAPGWAVGGWFIPIVQLFMPYQIMNELFRDTKRTLLEAYPDCSKQLPKNLAGLWWTILLLPIIPTSIMTLSLYIPVAIIVLNISNIVYLALNIAFPLITMKIIYDYSKMEKLLNR